MPLSIMFGTGSQFAALAGIYAFGGAAESGCFSVADFNEDDVFTVFHNKVEFAERRAVIRLNASQSMPQQIVKGLVFRPHSA